MTFFFLFFLSGRLSLYGSDSSYSSFLLQTRKEEKGSSFSPKEQIISGLTSFILGNIGYFSTDSKILKLGLSGVQTIGVINVGKGIHDSFISSWDHQYESLTRSFEALGEKVEGEKAREILSYHFVKSQAESERARRLAIFYASGLLGVQYFSNAFFDRSPGKLKDIFIFLGSINLGIMAYTHFFHGRYETFHFGKMEEGKVSWQFSPCLFLDPQGGGSYVKGISYSFSFR